MRAQTRYKLCSYVRKMCDLTYVVCAYGGASSGLTCQQSVPPNDAHDWSIPVMNIHMMCVQGVTTVVQCISTCMTV